MSWIWIAVAAIVFVIVAILVITIFLKSRRTTIPPGIDDIKRGAERYEQHMTERMEAIDGRIADSTKRLKKLNGQTEAAIKELEVDHEKIGDADDWDDLDAILDDIEGRR